MSDVIKPIDLPTAAGVAFGRGDVRHFSESDAVDVMGLQNPTRQLAERDNLLASKVNEIVLRVNNREQFVPLSILRTLLAPGTEEVVTNFSIPAGFEARVLSAAVASNPASSAVTLKIYYATGYGNLTGTELVSTADTFSSGVTFHNNGEFIVSLRNNGNTNLEAVASIILTVRPLGSVAGLLIGSVLAGPPGLPGPKGDKGTKGDPGSGGTGSPGLVWMGQFSSSTSYAPPDGISYSGTSYISILTNPASPYSVAPPNGTYWSLLAAAGTAGATGAGINWRGAWSSSNTYAVADAVSYVANSIASSYVCISAVGPSGTNPGADATHWDLLAGPVSVTAPVCTVAQVPGTFYYDAGYTLGPPDGSYLGTGSPGAGGPSEIQQVFFKEAAVVTSSVSPYGVAFLGFERRVVFSGTETLVLPQSDDGASVDWTGTNMQCTLVLDSSGTAVLDNAKVTSIGSSGSIVVVVPNDVQVKTSLQVNGFQAIV